MTDILRIGLPKVRMEPAVPTLLAEAGIRVTPTARGYRPHLLFRATEAKVLKPQNIMEMLKLGSRDVGFAGADWVAELSADVVEVLDTGLDPVELVAAAPAALLEQGAAPGPARRGGLRLVIVDTLMSRTGTGCSCGSRWTTSIRP